MRFITPRDYQAILGLNRELINNIIDTPVILYKLHQSLSPTNSYGEAPVKTWYSGVDVPCRIKRQDKTTNEDMQTINVSQNCEFAFLREELKDKGIYPEHGDIVYFDRQYYEIHNVNEVQLWGGRVEYRHSIVCDAHLTMKTTLQLERPNI